MSSGEQEEDPFWRVALEAPSSSINLSDDKSRLAENDEHLHEASGPIAVHQLSLYGRQFRLTLRSLPDANVVGDHLGAKAWYGAALLSSVLLQSDPRSRVQTHLDTVTRDGDGSVNVLELGSCAVGLTGLVLGLVLSQRKGRHSVVLTDNDAVVLKQLAENVQRNLTQLRSDHSDLTFPTYAVKTLDWSKDCDKELKDLHLVVGSELVYTQQTAEGCVRVVRSLLRRHPNLLVVLVQVTDRFGWENVFLPGLRQDDNLVVDEVPLVDAVLHATASRLVPHGGTLDRFAFGACYICNQCLRVE